MERLGWFEIAKDLSKKDNVDVDFHIDSCAELKVINDESIDLVISNYVLMDIEDYIGVIENTYRVLKIGLGQLHFCFRNKQY